MKRISRRKFLKLCSASALAVGLSQVWVPEIAEAFKKAFAGNPPVLWVQGSACSGCTTSLINTVNPDMKEVLTEIINLSYHPGFSDGAGNLLTDRLLETARSNRGKFILVLEGGIPRAHNGEFNIIGEDGQGNPVTLLKMVRELGRMAGSVVAVGSCASFGGIAAAGSNIPDCAGLERVVGVSKVVNIPGCPPHPDWIVGTLAQMLMFGIPETDDYGRPKLFYKGLIHNNCPRRQYFDNSIFARNFGEEGCLLYIGCKGPLAHGDCPTRMWNGASSWCVSVNGPCIGCTEPTFPDLAMPFYKRMPDIKGPGITSTADKIGVGLGIATAAGLTAHLAGNYLKGRIGPQKHDREGDI